MYFCARGRFKGGTSDEFRPTPGNHRCETSGGRKASWTWHDRLHTLHNPTRFRSPQQSWPRHGHRRIKRSLYGICGPSVAKGFKAYSWPPRWRSNSARSLWPSFAASCKGVRPPRSVLAIDIGAVGQQQFHHVLMAFNRRIVQGRIAVVGLGIDSPNRVLRFNRHRLRPSGPEAPRRTPAFAGILQQHASCVRMDAALCHSFKSGTFRTTSTGYLCERAEQERRSLAQQVVAVLARGLDVEVDAKARRRALLASIQSIPPVRGHKPSDPAKLIREDRRR